MHFGHLEILGLFLVYYGWSRDPNAATSLDQRDTNPGHRLPVEVRSPIHTTLQKIAAKYFHQFRASCR
jgi:hypothetical protein